MSDSGDTIQLRPIIERMESIKAELSYIIEGVEDPDVQEALKRMTTVFELQYTAQVAGLAQLLAKICINQKLVDEELNDIAEYLATIVGIHQSESENLKKLL
jgi:hypothetical protein